jgi:hypothetical protein
MDPYTVLGVARSADGDEVRRAWRRRVRETHPDHGGDGAAFLDVQRAFRRLEPPSGGTGPAPVLVRHLSPPALARRWWRRRCDSRGHPRVA